MGFYTDNPLRDFAMYDSDQQKQLENLPKCSLCDEPIQQEDVVQFHGEYICDDCLDDLRVELRNLYD